MRPASLDFKRLIQSGIEKANGDFEDINFVRSDWLLELGVRAVEHRKRIRSKFHSWILKPFSDVELAVKRSKATSKALASDGVIIDYGGQEKEVYVIPFGRMIGENEYEMLLHELGFKPCKFGPSYLLRLMVQVPLIEMPVDLRDKNIVAAEPNNPSSFFPNNVECKGFMCLRQNVKTQERELGDVLIGGGEWPENWAFLAERF